MSFLSDINGLNFIDEQVVPVAKDQWSPEVSKITEGGVLDTNIAPNEPITDENRDQLQEVAHARRARIAADQNRQLEQAQGQQLILEAQQAISKTQARIADLEQRLADMATNAGRYTLNIQRRPALKRAARKLFGGGHNEITPEMYRQALAIKDELEQEGVTGKFKGKP